MLMHVEEPNDALASVGIPLAAPNQSSDCNNFRYKSLIYLLLLIVPVGIPFIVLSLLLVVLDEHSVHVSSEERASVVSIYHPVWIDHRDDFEDKSCSELPS